MLKIDNLDLYLQVLYLKFSELDEIDVNSDYRDFKDIDIEFYEIMKIYFDVKFKYIDSFIELNGFKAEKYSGIYNLILALFSDANLDSASAIKYFNKAIGTNDSNQNKWIYLEYSQYYIESNFEKSQLYLERSLELDSHFLPSKILQISFIDFYEFPNVVIESLAPIYFTYDLKVPLLLNSLGNANMALNKYEFAQKYFRESLEFKDNIDAFHGLAIVSNLYLGDLQKAENYFKSALELDPYDFGLAVSYLDFILFDNDKIGLSSFVDDCISQYGKDVTNMFSFIKLLLEAREDSYVHKMLESIERNNSWINRGVLDLIIEQVSFGKSSRIALEGIEELEEDIELKNIYKTIWELLSLE